MHRNVFVLGLDETNLATLEGLPGADRYRFHGLLSIEELQHGDDIPFDELLDRATEQLEAFPEPVDAVIGYWDFPVSSMVPILSARFGLRSAPLSAVVKCEHKWWSRLEQAAVIDALPGFELVDLDADAPPPELAFPLWLKPVKSFSSALAFRVEDDDGFREALQQIREGIDRVGKPFERVLAHLDLPPHIAEVGGRACLAEEQVVGRQVTVEGYALDGHVTVYGVVDSICYPDSTSFLRFQYPSQIPTAVRERMVALSEKVISQVGLDATTFNVEYFWDPDTDAVNLLEINPRHSQSHAYLFTDVDGMPNHKAMVELALGRDPQLTSGEGRWAIAAKWFWRRFTDGRVVRAPTAEEVAAVERDVDGVTIELVATEGDVLSEMWDQDSYSFKLANLYIGAADVDELEDKYERCIAALPYEFADVTSDDAAS